MIKIIPSILKGVPVCLEITAVSFIFGVLIGILVALIRIYKVKVLSQLAAVYVSFTRGTPLLVQILITYYGLPILFRWVNYKFGLSISINKIPAVYYMFFCYSFCIGAYLSEMFRAAILSVDPGQMEACYSIGMSTTTGMMRIVLPQAFTNAIPNLGNTFVTLIKDTSLAFTAAICEVMGQAKIIAGRDSKFLEAYIVAALIYWAMCLLCEPIIKRLERYSRRFERGGNLKKAK